MSNNVHKNHCFTDDITADISANDNNWYQAVTRKLTPEQVELLQTLLLYAEQRRAQTGQLL